MFLKFIFISALFFFTKTRKLCLFQDCPEWTFYSIHDAYASVKSVYAKSHGIYFRAASDRLDDKVHRTCEHEHD